MQSPIKRPVIVINKDPLPQPYNEPIRLPTDLWRYVLLFLDLPPQKLYEIERTCRLFHKILNEKQTEHPLMGSFWKSRYENILKILGPCKQVHPSSSYFVQLDEQIRIEKEIKELREKILQTPQSKEPEEEPEAPALNQTNHILQQSSENIQEKPDTTGTVDNQKEVSSESDIEEKKNDDDDEEDEEPSQPVLSHTAYKKQRRQNREKKRQGNKDLSPSKTKTTSPPSSPAYQEFASRTLDSFDKLTTWRSKAVFLVNTRNNWSVGRCYAKNAHINTNWICSLCLKGNTLYAGSGDGRVYIWKVLSEDDPVNRWRLVPKKRVIQAHSSTVSAIEIDSKRIVTGSWSGNIKIWDWDMRKGKSQFHVGAAPRSSVEGMSLMEEHDQIAVAWNGDPSEVWNMSTGTLVSRFGAQGAWFVEGCSTSVLGPNCFASGGAYSGTVYLWDIRADSRLDAIEAHKHDVHRAKFFSHDPNMMFSGGADGTVFAWDLRWTAEPESVMKLPTFNNQNTTVMEILLNKDHLVAFGTNGVIYFYDPNLYNFQYMMMAHTDRINAAVMDEFKIISMCADGTMRVSAFDSTEPNFFGVQNFKKSKKPNARRAEYFL